MLVSPCDEGGPPPIQPRAHGTLYERANPHVAAPESAYGHIAAFARNAPQAQAAAFWAKVGSTYESLVAQKGDRPVCAGTEGPAVPWLHRADGRCPPVPATRRTPWGRVDVVRPPRVSARRKPLGLTAAGACQRLSRRGAAEQVGPNAPRPRRTAALVLTRARVSHGLAQIVWRSRGARQRQPSPASAATKRGFVPHGRDCRARNMGSETYAHCRAAGATDLTRSTRSQYTRRFGAMAIRILAWIIRCLRTVAEGKISAGKPVARRLPSLMLTVAASQFVLMAFGPRAAVPSGSGRRPTLLSPRRTWASRARAVKLAEVVAPVHT